jgi:hypothetical protein
MHPDARSRRGLALLLVSLGWFGACGPHEEVTPLIPISPGAGARICQIASRCAGDPQGQGARIARAHVLEPGQELGGPAASGRPGDIVLENGEVVFVISASTHAQGYAESGGTLIDAADARAREDDLGQVFTTIGRYPRQVMYEAVSFANLPDGSAEAVAKGRDQRDASLEVETHYRLAAPDRALLIETTMSNRGKEPTDTLAFGDAITWGATEKFAPGHAPGFAGPFRASFVGGLGRNIAYALTTTDGEVSGHSGSTWTDTQVIRTKVAPGRSVSFSRVFVVGERPDSSSVVSELSRSSAAPLGRLIVQLSEGGQPVRAPASLRLFVGGSEEHPLMTIAPSAEGTFTADLPPGDYRVGLVRGGERRATTNRAGTQTMLAVRIERDLERRASLAIGAAGRLAVRCLDARAQAADVMPCVVDVAGVGETPDPYFGGPADLEHGTAIYAPDGVVRRAIAPGNYRVVVSRGLEYEPQEFPLSVEGPNTPEIEVRLERVIDTQGFVPVDLHQHSLLGTDAPASPRTRALANAVQGLIFTVASEHDRIGNLGPVLDSLSLTGKVTSLPGVEFTSDQSERPFGHFNVFPLMPRDGEARAGVPFALAPASFFAAMRARPERPLIQVAHPRSPQGGYFRLMGFDPDTQKASDPRFDLGFDLVEVWNSDGEGERDLALRDYLALVRMGRRVTPTANSDTHRMWGQEPGFPRTYVRTSPSGALNSAALLETLRGAPDVVLTNGPFVRATLEPSPLVRRGQSAAPLKVNVRVECTSWVKVDTLEIWSAERPMPQRIPLDLRRAPTRPGGPATGAWTANVTVPLTQPAQSAAPSGAPEVLVVVRGTGTLGAIATGAARSQHPFAMTSVLRGTR